MTVRELMTSQVVTVKMDESIGRVRELFEASGFHHVVVLDGGRVAGVISDRDLLKHVSPFIGRAFTERAQDVATLNRRVHQIMTRQPVTATPETDVSTAATLLIEKRISCLPVVGDDDRLVGIVTWKDLLRAVIKTSEPAAAVET